MLKRMCLSCQCVCHSHPLELPSDDAGLEDGSLFSRWKHCSPQTCSGLRPTAASLYEHMCDCVVFIHFFPFVGDSINSPEICRVNCQSGISKGCY